MDGVPDTQSTPSFAGALSILKSGGNVCRTGWNGKGQYLGLQLPDENSANTLPYIYIMTVDAKRVPWVASQTDLLAEDWEEINSGEQGATSNE